MSLKEKGEIKAWMQEIEGEEKDEKGHLAQRKTLMGDREQRDNEGEDKESEGAGSWAGTQRFL